ncbi:TIGR03086 family metal-binding protein [Rhodococcoides yunnanense]|uniref:TIGR03086 family metal-binding protein n=1 Tax=Rhodococcoides yunnanense TaxID=278209 RepID=UPI000A010B2B|nr:TIGR03086 family metal-binding protein [Rhodococcus yunnanensis]
MDTLREVHARAVQLTVDAVSPISVGSLSAPTPCSEWDLAQLLDHMTVQNFGFAAAAGGSRDEDVWNTGMHLDNLVVDYLESAERVIEAFSASDVVDRQFYLPELSREQQFIGSQAVTMHAIDSMIHSWDVARAVGSIVEPDFDLVEMTIEIVEQIPDNEERRKPGAHFGPRASIGDTTGSRFDTALALLGRSPRWPQN